MKKYAKLISSSDNVVTSVADIKAGEEFFVKVEDKELSYKSNHDVPFGHKIAIVNIEKDGPVIKYGETIGLATARIRTGDWVHTHNVRDHYEVK
ncbi:MAG: UxaA family hydrolase [Peptococcaceae bacterium]|nr:UxaA family hydrolase [Peptococcaceae bacterium]MDH7525012.1 UxaA family hydrolase [Peptococcaceae bacterium]